ncbi:UNVERIFIED_CONTAM: hypothetical protein HDU68_001831 [Siphonaria sp. JEL0065]|nr:hypothetical protein HDU68_001831 [Siphonaria sp. JEL0065]
MLHEHDKNDGRELDELIDSGVSTTSSADPSQGQALLTLSKQKSTLSACPFYFSSLSTHVPSLASIAAPFASADFPTQFFDVQCEYRDSLIVFLRRHAWRFLDLDSSTVYVTRHNRSSAKSLSHSSSSNYLDGSNVDSYRVSFSSVDSVGISITIQYRNHHVSVKLVKSMDYNAEDPITTYNLVLTNENNKGLELCFFQWLSFMFGGEVSAIPICTRDLSRLLEISVLGHVSAGYCDNFGSTNVVITLSDCDKENVVELDGNDVLDLRDRFLSILPTLPGIIHTPSNLNLANESYDTLDTTCFRVSMGPEGGGATCLFKKGVSEGIGKLVRVVLSYLSHLQQKQRVSPQAQLGVPKVTIQPPTPTGNDSVIYLAPAGEVKSEFPQSPPAAHLPDNDATAVGKNSGTSPNVEVDPHTLSAWISITKLQDLETRSSKLMHSLATKSENAGKITADDFKAFEDATAPFSEYQETVNKLLGKEENVGEVLNSVADGLVEAFSVIADIHPILKIAWFVAKAGYKMAKDASMVEEGFQTLLQKFLDSAKEIDCLKNLPTKGIPAETSRMFGGALNDYIDCLCLVLDHYLEYVDSPKKDLFTKAKDAFFATNTKALEEITKKLDDCQKTMIIVKQGGSFEIVVHTANIVEDTKEIVIENRVALDQMQAHVAEIVSGIHVADSDEMETEAIREHCQFTFVHNAGDRSVLNGVRCVGTRDRVVQRLTNAIDNCDPSKKIFWLRSAPGHGKSVIAAAVATELHNKKVLGAAFFCRKNDMTRNNASAVIQTIAYELSQGDKVFQKHLSQSLIDSKFKEKHNPSIVDVLRAFIRIPFHNTASTTLKVILIDGLDILIDEKSVSAIFETFQSLGPHVKLFVTSRLSVRVPLKKDAFHIDVFGADHDEIWEDVRVYVRETLTGQEVSEEVQKIFVPALVESAKGSLFWVSLVLGVEGDVGEDQRDLIAEAVDGVEFSHEKALKLVEQLVSNIPQEASSCDLPCFTIAMFPEISNIPQEIVEEILKHLPIDSNLFSVGFASKFFLAPVLFESHSFAWLHTNYQSIQESRHTAMLQCFEVGDDLLPLAYQAFLLARMFDKQALDTHYDTAPSKIVLKWFQILLSKPIYFDPTRFDNMPLHFATLHGHTEAVRLILSDSRVDPSTCLKNLVRAVLSNTSAKGGGCNMEMAKLLLQHKKADRKAAFREAARFGHVQVLQFLVDDGRVNLLARTAGTNIRLGNYALYSAIEGEHSDVVLFLLSLSEVDPSANDNRAIREAAYSNFEILKMLVQDRRVDPTVDDDYVLRRVCALEKMDAVEFLVALPHVNPSAGNDYCLRISKERSNWGIVQLLLASKGATVTQDVDSGRFVKATPHWLEEEPRLFLVFHFCLYLYIFLSLPDGYWTLERTLIIQGIFSYIPPADIPTYCGLCRRIQTALSDVHFAAANLKTFVPLDEITSSRKTAATRFDVLFFRSLPQYQTAYANLVKKHLQFADWEAKPEGNSITGWPLINQTFGKIPPQIGTLINLKELFLGRNGLTGEIPVELARLSLLEILHLPRNQLSGSIPKEIGALSNLMILSFEDNNLSGEIPTELYELTKLESMHLNMNMLSGEIPVGISRLVNLKVVSFDSNRLTGKVPVDLGELENVNWPLLQWQANRFDQVLPKGMKREGRVWTALIRQGFRPDDDVVLNLEGNRRFGV